MVVVDNPIILKEFVQAAHRRRTYVLRAVLPLVALAIIGPRVVVVLFESGQDWRAISQVARPIFSTCVWMQMIVFPLMAVSYAGSSLNDEWTRRTMELLCGTPISKAGIVYGKYAGALGRAFLIGLAFLPVMGIWFRLGHIPRSVALGSIGVIVAGTALFGALSLAEAASFRAVKPRSRSGLCALLLYPATVVLLGIFVWEQHPLLIAALPPWAFYYVTTGVAPGGMAPASFILLAMAAPLAVSALVLLAAPLLFGWTFNRYLGERGAARGMKRLLPRYWRRRLVRRRPLGPYANPFRWQEEGAPTRLLSWAVWLVYGVVATVMVGLSFTRMDMRFLGEAAFYLVMAIVGLVVTGLGAGLYGLGVFAREKQRNTAQALILTGCAPRQFYRGKIAALFSALWKSYLAVGGALVVCLVLGWDDTSSREILTALAAIVSFGLIGPVAAGVIGMAFSAAAKSSSHALGGVMLSFLFSWLASMALMMPLGFLFAFMRMGAMAFGGAIMGGVAGAGIYVLCRFTRSWKLWRLSLMLGLTWVAISGVVQCLAVLCSEYLLGITEFAAWGSSLLSTVAMGVFWWFLGLHIFESCMLDDVQPRRRSKKPLPTAKPVRDSEGRMMNDE